MTKQLIIFRHADADSGGSFSGDHDRKLSKQGESSAALMGRVLAKTNDIPEFALCSTAVRAQSTLVIASREGEWLCTIENTDILYNTTPEETLRLIQTVSDEYNRLMIVGHEPTWSTLTSQLVGGGRFRFRTASMACIEFGVSDWQGIKLGGGSVSWFIQPALFSTQ